MDPPDFDLNAISDLLGNISPEELEKISSLALGLAGGEKADEKQEEGTDNGSGFNLDPEMLFRIMEIFNRLNSQQNDPRCNLISALKPLLSPQKREKADRAIEMLRLVSIFSLFGME